jgi:hypothetical protein
MNRPMARRLTRILNVLGLGAVVVFGGCVAGAPPGRRFVFFERAAPGDPWSPKIAGWQARERAMGAADQLAPGAPGTTVASGPADARPSTDDLRVAYFAFRAEQKRATARAAAAWIQEQSRHHYIPDGPVDHWATLEETLAHNGDDCDGLELLTYHFLRDAGFRDDEVFRAIVMRPSDGQHHMVTLWFEDPTDPWVIDPTGAMTTGMPRLSEVPDWVPIEIFTETVEYTVHPAGPAAFARALLPVAPGRTDSR